MSRKATDPLPMPQVRDTLQAYAALRGHRLTANEIDHALMQSGGLSPEQLVDSAWTLLLPRERLGRVPLSRAERSHFPALSWRGDTLEILRAAESGDAADTLLTPCPLTDSRSALSASLEDAGAPPRPAADAIRVVLSAHGSVFARIGLATVFINVLAIVSSVFAMQVYDRVVPNFSYPTLWVLASGVLLAVCFDLVFKYLRLTLTESATKRIDEALSQFFFEKMLALKLDRRPAHPSQLISQIRDYESVKAFLTSTTLFAIADMPFILFFIVMIALLGNYVALVPLCLVPLCIAVGLAVQRPLARLQQRQTDEIARRQGVLIEAVSAAESVKAQGGEWRYAMLWQRLTRETADDAERMRILGGKAQFIAGALQQVAYVLVMVVGVFRIEAGDLTTGGLIACSILAQRAMASTTQLTGILVQWQHARHALHVLDRLMALPTDANRRVSGPVGPHDLALQGVRYAYETDGEPVMTIESLRIDAGQRIAVLGRNGSGKSTLLKLLAGLATPVQGQVSLAGLDLQQCRLGWLRETVGYLPQDVRLFGGTLRENLTVGIDQPAAGHLQAVLQATGLDRFVSRLPQGLDTLIREGGIGLSGGQRQLIGLTRLALLQPRIWLLDEPSASLDQESEQRMMALLRALPPEVTVVITTHRMGWLALTRRTLLVEDGRIRADVPTEQVRAQSGSNNGQATATVPGARA